MMRVCLAASLVLALAPWSHSAAARDIYENPTADDVPALLAALGDPGLQFGTIRALARVGEPAALPLAKALEHKDGDPEIRLCAAFALGEIGPAAHGGTGSLIRAAAEDDATLRAVAIEALGKLGPAARSSQKPLARALSDEEPQVRQRAAAALGLIRADNAKVIHALIRSLHDEATRASAIESLRQIGPAAVAPLTAALEEDDLRPDAVLVLRVVDGPAARKAGVDRMEAADVPILVRAIAAEDRCDESRIAAIELLGELVYKNIGHPADLRPAIDPLVAALSVEALRPAAIQRLAGLDNLSVPALMGALKSEDPRVREAAATTLGKTGIRAIEAVPALIEVLEGGERDRYVRCAVCQTLGELTPDPDRAVPALVKVLSSDRDEQVCQAAIKALEHADPAAKEAVVAALLSSLKTGNYGIRQLAGQTLKKLDPEAAKAAGVR